MKKKDPPKQKMKEFAISPFKSLKGLQADVAEPPAKAAVQRVKPAAREVDDAELFLREMAGVSPLTSVPAGAKDTRHNGPQPKLTSIPPAEQRLFLHAVEKLALDVVFSDELPEDVKPLRPLSSSRLRQLKKGAIHIDYELDLHGLTKDEALASLASFITGAYARGQKGVLVITGKGNNSLDGPVLQTAVAGWLRDRGKTMVAEFTPAPRRLGGSGAFVVFLKEKVTSSLSPQL